MKLLRHVMVACVMLMTSAVFAQDIHFTQFQMSPLTLNPANAGAFAGTVRLGGIFRDQWNYIGTPKGFRTPSLFVDAPIIRGIRKQDWVGVGVSMYQDAAGTGKLTNSNLGLSAAYHIAIDKKQKSILTIGGQYGFFQRRLADKGALTTEEMLSGGSNTDFGSLSSQADGTSDLAMGLTFRTPLNKRMGLKLGFSMAHLLRAKNGLLTTGNSASYQMPIRSVLHGEFDMVMTPKLSLHPAFMFQSMAGANEIAIQAMAGYKLKPESAFTLRGGLGYRMRDAAKFLLGVDVGQLRVGAAYDLNLSDLTPVTNNHGGFELAANYIIKLYKTPNPPAVILCPKF